jgi:hypothetical protein
MTGRTGHLGQDNQDRIAIRGQPRQSVSAGLPVKVRPKVNPDDNMKCKEKLSASLRITYLLSLSQMISSILLSSQVITLSVKEK